MKGVLGGSWRQLVPRLRSGLPASVALYSKFLRCFPPGTPGKSRFSRWLLRPHLDIRDVEVRVPCGVGFRVPHLGEPIAFYLLIDGIYEPGLVEFLLAHLGHGATFVDVGANIGAFAILAARKVGPKGCVVALEPSRRVFPYLCGNVISNRVEGVILEQCAAGEEDQEGLLFYEAPAEHFGMGALAPQFHSEPVTVRGCRLDSVLERNGIRRVDIVKVDVEGSEAFVFRGAEKLLTGKNPPTVVFEFCDWAEERFGVGVGEAQRVLRNYGYKIWRLDSFGRRFPALDAIVTAGFDTLVGVRPS